MYLCAFVTVSLTITCQDCLLYFDLFCIFTSFLASTDCNHIYLSRAFCSSLEFIQFRFCVNVIFILIYSNMKEYRILSCNSKIRVPSEFNNQHLIKLTNSLYMMSVISVLFHVCFRFMVNYNPKLHESECKSLNYNYKILYINIIKKMF